LLKIIGALFYGGLVSFIGVVLHNSLHPIGIILALLATAVGISFAGQLFGARKFKVIAAVGWLIISLRAGTYGLSHEILIISNIYGNIFLLGGLLFATIAAVKKN